MTTVASPSLLQSADNYLAQAQTSPLNLDQYKSTFIERALRDVTSTSHDSSSATAMDPTNPLAVAIDVEAQKDYFRQLKFQYLEQESKRHFLFLITDSEPNGPTRRDNEELEQINGEKKALLKQTKLEIEDMRKETIELAGKNAQRHTKVSKQTTEIQSLQSQIRALELELSRLHATHPPSERLTIPMAEEVLDKQVVELQDVTEARDRAVAEAEARRDEVSRVAKEVARLAREREKEEARALEVREGREGGDTKVDDLCRWYTTTLGMYKSLLGIQNVSTRNENELHITYEAPTPSRSITLAMALDPITQRLCGAAIEGIDIEEAVNIAVQSNDIPGLIGDVLVRIRKGC